MWSAIVLAAAVLAVLATIVIITKVLGQFRRKAQQAGYPSLSAYLNAPPRTDQEKRDAVDLCLKGLVLCMLGLIFPPLILFGVIPLFYGGRKLAWSMMGFGLYDDPSSQDG